MHACVCAACLCVCGVCLSVYEHMFAHVVMHVHPFPCHSILIYVTFVGIMSRMDHIIDTDDNNTRNSHSNNAVSVVMGYMQI